jgi:hypothetical protein
MTRFKLTCRPRAGSGSRNGIQTRRMVIAMLSKLPGIRLTGSEVQLLLATYLFVDEALR